MDFTEVATQLPSWLLITGLVSIPIGLIILFMYLDYRFYNRRK